MATGRIRVSQSLPICACLSLVVLALIPALAHGATSLTERPGQRGIVAPRAIGGLDCNGLSPIQRPVKTTMVCADPRNPTSDDGRLSEHGKYIGHDEPDLNFASSKPGSGDNLSWTFTIGKDPSAAPTGNRPGADISHYFELTPALWISMNICDPQSYPILPCKPNSDANAPSGHYPGAGGAFMELQFYPPGFAPWVDNISIDNQHWVAALNVDSLEETAGFTNENDNCLEPVNFSYIQTNGVPTGPPSPQLSDLSSVTTNSHTLFMNPGDRIRVHAFDAPVPGGDGKALETLVTDLTTGQSGFMQASGANGFMNTSIVDCSGTPFNFEPEYNTASPANVTPWGAGTEVISASFETGHFTPCSTIHGKFTQDFGNGVTDPAWSDCAAGPYESAAPGGDGGGTPEQSDEPCYPKGDTHNGLAAGAPNEITGCTDFDIGDLDFDGSAYWKEWPTSTSPTTTPATFRFSPPTTHGAQYERYQFQTDLGFEEVTTCDPGTPNGCAVPPPNAPGSFYPFWTLAGSSSSCQWEFGRVLGGKVFGGERQYGTINPKQFPDISSRFLQNTCTG
jgi:hypothetical protein